MLELLGQTNLYKGDSYIDMAPSVQFIFNSRIRVDAGYRFAMLNNLNRHEQNSVLLRLEYNFLQCNKMIKKFFRFILSLFQKKDCCK